MYQLRLAILSALLMMPVSAQASTVLECRGFSSKLKKTVIHYIEIDGTTAKLDDQAYKVVVDTAISLQLSGPIRDDAPNGDPNWPNSVIINRVSGDYVMSYPGSRNRKDDWSRSNDQGCIKVSTQF